MLWSALKCSLGIVCSFRYWFLAASLLVVFFARLARCARWVGASCLQVNSKVRKGGKHPPIKAVGMVVGYGWACSMGLAGIAPP